jgi:hypothetical protein
MGPANDEVGLGYFPDSLRIAMRANQAHRKPKEKLRAGRILKK